MSYQASHERFQVAGPHGETFSVEFVRAGFLAQADRPELFFFRVHGRVNGEEAVVGISGASLTRFERGRPHLTREQKINITGSWLKRQIEAGMPLDSRNLYIQDNELANLAGELDSIERGGDETL